MSNTCKITRTQQQPSDYSSIKVNLITLSGVTKDSSECAPNGYYLFPVYDKGEYNLVVEGPQGWNFGKSKLINKQKSTEINFFQNKEPNQIRVKVEEDKCNGGEHINFELTGFAISGKVKTVECSGDEVGVVTIALYQGDKKVSQINSDARGNYEFKNLKPGDYQIKATHSSWSFSRVIKFLNFF